MNKNIIKSLKYQMSIETMLENINIKYFDDLNKEAIPQHQTSADVFHTEDCEIFAIHGHEFES